MLDVFNIKFYFIKWFKYKFYVCSLSKFINLIIKSVWFNCYLVWFLKFFDYKIKKMVILWGEIWKIFNDICWIIKNEMYMYM